MNTRIEDVYEILERITDGFFAVDKCWNFTFVNTEATRLLFRSRDDLIGKNVWIEFPEAVNSPFYQHYYSAVTEQVPVFFEAYFPPLHSWFAVRAFPSSNGLTVYFRDITIERMESTQKEQHYKSLFQHNPDAVFSFDLNGNYFSVNPAMEQLLGYSEKEYMQRTFVPLVSSDDIDRTINHYKKAVSGTTQRYEAKALHKDGSIIHLDVTNMPIIVNDEVVGVYGIAKDITSRKRSEDALKAKSQQLESLIENNVDSILIFNRQGKVINVNKAFEDTFGWSKREMFGLEIGKLPNIPAERMDEVMELKSMVEKGSDVTAIESVRVRKDGAILNIIISISPIKDAAEEFVGWSATLRDITEWKKSQELLKNTEKLSIAGQLAAGIAHEIRNPMTAIKGFIQLMNYGHEGNQAYLNIMSSEIERIEQILSELLILAKPQVSKFEQKEIKVLLSQVITLLDTQAILNNVEIVTEFEAGEIWIPCDENQLKQVFINYIKNAIEAMPDGGKLVIQLRKAAQDQIHIRFIDNGVGMSEEILTKLGEPFYSTKEKG
ncbi:PAS domain S-box protein, partial [Neobacillus drentensis]|uniref:PAS domain S-box protein n=1 Tax=Neobacillus drentensis TaxID=220684 RepID=UPI002FFD7794